MLARDIGEPARDVRPAGEYHTFDLRPDRRQRGADIVRAIEKSGEAGLGNRIARRRDNFTKPARPDVAAGTRRADQYHRPVRSRRRG